MKTHLRNYFYITCLLLLTFIQLNAQSRVIGYYADWLKDTLPVSKIKFEHLTHINHAFAWPEEDGSLSMYQNMLNPYLNSKAHENGVKMIISLGGWGNSYGFAAMAADSDARSNFIENLVDFLNFYDYDGADFDWEFPETSTHKANFVKLIQELRTRFDEENPEWVITMAVGISNWTGQWFDFNELKKSVDWFNVMCYDIHGNWSAHSGPNAPLFQATGDVDGSITTAMTYLNVTRAIPKTQLNVGIPFYGKKFISAAFYTPFTGTVTDMRYSDIAPLVGNGWVYNWDNVCKVPYLKDNSNSMLITYDDTTSVRTKCEWIKEKGYSGAMIWALGQDLIGEQQLLLETIGKSLLQNTSPVVEKEEEIPATFYMEANYPNPFNPSTTIPFRLNENANVVLSVYSVNGQEIASLINDYRVAGNYSVKFNASDHLSSGVYIVKLKTKRKTISRKIMLIR